MLWITIRFTVIFTIILRFTLNEFYWIHWWQYPKVVWLPEVLPQLATNTVPFIAIKYTFSLLPMVKYPLWLTTVNRYHFRHSNGNIFFTSTSRNVTVVKYRVSSITILLLDFVLFHWIQRNEWKWYNKKSFFRKKIEVITRFGISVPISNAGYGTC